MPEGDLYQPHLWHHSASSDTLLLDPLAAGVVLPATVQPALHRLVGLSGLSESGSLAPAEVPRFHAHGCTGLVCVHSSALFFPILLSVYQRIISRNDRLPKLNSLDIMMLCHEETNRF